MKAALENVSHIGALVDGYRHKYRGVDHATMHIGLSEANQSQSFLLFTIKLDAMCGGTRFGSKKSKRSVGFFCCCKNVNCIYCHSHY